MNKSELAEQVTPPEGTDLVVIAGPRTGLLPPELQILSEYLGSGGRVLLLLDPILNDTGLEETGFGEWLAQYGLRLGDNIVIDQDNPLPFFSAESYYHRIRREFRTCYKDNGQPPTGAGRRYTVVWEPGRRLVIRQELEETLAQWAARPD